MAGRHGHLLQFTAIVFAKRIEQTKSILKSEMKKFGWDTEEVRRRMQQLHPSWKGKEAAKKISQSGKKKKRSKAVFLRQKKLWAEDLELPQSQAHSERIMLPFSLKKVSFCSRPRNSTPICLLLYIPLNIVSRKLRCLWTNGSLSHMSTCSQLYLRP